MTSVGIVRNGTLDFEEYIRTIIDCFTIRFQSDISKVR